MSRLTTLLQPMRSIDTANQRMPRNSAASPTSAVQTMNGAL